MADKCFGLDNSLKSWTRHNTFAWVIESLIHMHLWRWSLQCQSTLTEHDSMSLHSWQPTPPKEESEWRSCSTLDTLLNIKLPSMTTKRLENPNHFEIFAVPAALDPGSRFKHFKQFKQFKQFKLNLKDRSPDLAPLPVSESFSTHWASSPRSFRSKNLSENSIRCQKVFSARSLDPLTLWTCLVHP